MITTQDKALVALTESRRHEVKAQLCNDPIIAEGHREVARILAAIVADYTDRKDVSA